MTEPSLSLQKAIRARLVSHAPLVALVPASNILDKNQRPEVFPCLLIGEAQVISDSDLARQRVAVHMDLHIFHKETGLVQSKAIVGEVREALKAKFGYADEWQVIDVNIASTRFMRDPGGIHSHGVISLDAECRET